MKTCPACSARFSLTPPVPDVCFNCWSTYRSAPPQMPAPAKKSPPKRKHYVN